MIEKTSKDIMMNKNSHRTCCVCGSMLLQGYQSWHFICSQCNYEKSELQPAINMHSTHALINEDSRINGLRTLRMSNFKNLLKHIKLKKPNGGTLLEVGSAHGWFLEVAKNDFCVLGIEPDKTIVKENFDCSIPIRCGYFPNCLKKNEYFDVIVFNDVIEHIPNLEECLDDCFQHLNENGLLVLNLPSSKGFFYKFAKIFSVLGFAKPFERMWQKSLPSPHLHYFNPKNITELLHINKFACISEVKKLPSIRFNGLYSRIAYTGNYNLILRICIYLTIGIILPILKFLPSDIMYVIAQRQGLHE